MFEARSSPAWTERDPATSREHPGARNPLRAAWDQLEIEIDRANRPRGRATAGVREVVRRIARLMMAEGATREEIHDALVRAVMKQHRMLADVAARPGVSVNEALLADVLHCAATAADD